MTATPGSGASGARRGGASGARGGSASEATPSGGASEARGSVDVFHTVTAVGSPIALATALLLYFGWVRSQAQAEAFGTDISVFEMTPQDLVLRSIDVLFFPIMLLLLAALLLLHIDPWIRARAGVVGNVLRYAWLLAPVGFVVAWLARSVGYYLLPLFVMLAIGATAYGISLRRATEPGRPGARLATIALVGALLTATLFWQTERLAVLGGNALADDIQRNLPQRLQPVTVLSAGRLHIGGPRVVEADLAGGASTYRFRYEGLYLLQRSGDKYFLLTDGWDDGDGRLVILGDSETIRLEFGG